MSVGKLIFSAQDDGSPFVIHFAPTEIADDLRCLEHVALGWATIDEIQRLELAPSDKRFVGFLLEKE